MSNSKLIELSYYDPSAQVRLSVYPQADSRDTGGKRACFRFRKRAHPSPRSLTAYV